MQRCWAQLTVYSQQTDARTRSTDEAQASSPEGSARSWSTRHETCKSNRVCMLPKRPPKSLSEPRSLDPEPCSEKSLKRLLKAKRPSWHRLSTPMIEDQMGCCGVGGIVTHQHNKCLKLSWLPWCSFPVLQSQAHYPEAILVSGPLMRPLPRPLTLS